MKRSDADNLISRGCLTLACVFIAFFILAFLCAVTGCKHIEYVTVPEVHEVHHHHTDSIHQTDSTIIERETTVMQLDSATMAKYGIQLAAAERAWLVKTKELERALQRMYEMKADTLYVHDSIPYPVTEYKEVERQLTWWQQTRMHIGGIVLFIGAIILAYKILKWKSII